MCPILLPHSSSQSSTMQRTYSSPNQNLSLRTKEHHKQQLPIHVHMITEIMTVLFLMQFIKKK